MKWYNTIIVMKSNENREDDPMEQQLPAKFQEFGEARKAGFLRVKQLK